MSILTWRDVAAPDFSSSLAGVRTASQMFNDALSSAQSGLNTYDKSQTDKASNAIMLAAMGARDPATFDPTAYTAGVDPRRINADTLNFLANRRSTLLNQAHEALANTELSNTIDKDQYEFGRTKDANAAMDAADPILRKAAMISASGPDGEAKAQAFLALPENAPVLAKLHASQLTDAIKSTQGLTEGELNLDSKRTSNDSSALAYQKDKVNWQDSRDVDRVIASVLPHVIDAAGADRYLNEHPDLLKGVSPTAELTLREGLRTRLGGGASGPGGGGASSGVTPTAGGPAVPALNAEALANLNFDQVKNNIIAGEGTDHLGGYDAIAYNTANGGNAAGVKAPKPVSQMSLGELYNWQRGSMRPMTKGQRGSGDIGSTGVGAYQLESDTMRQAAQALFGDKWQDQKFTPQVQDQLARQVFDSSKSNPALFGNQWAYTKQLVQQGNYQARTTGINTTIGNNMMGDVNRPITKDFLQGWDDQTSDYEVARSLTGAGDPKTGGGAGPLAGAGVDTVLSKIQEIKQKYGVNAAVAGAIINRSVRPLRLSDELDILHPFLGQHVRWGGSLGGHYGGMTLDEDRIQQQGNLFKDGKGVRDSAIAQQQQEQAQQSVAQAQALYDSARAAYVNAANVAATQKKDIDLRPYLENMQKAQSMLNATQQYGAQIAVDGQHNPAPPPPPPAQQLADSARPSSADTRRFGPLGIHVPVGQFQTHDALANYVNQKTSMIHSAQGILRMGGAVGQQYRQQFQKQWGMTPEQAIAQLPRLQG